MRINPRLYGIHMKEYPNAIGLCMNIRRKGVEEQETKVRSKGSKGASTGPT